MRSPHVQAPDLPTSHLLWRKKAGSLALDAAGSIEIFGQHGVQGVLGQESQGHRSVAGHFASPLGRYLVSGGSRGLVEGHRCDVEGDGDRDAQPVVGGVQHGRYGSSARQSSLRLEP
jgi:hypothetical protein